MKAPYVAFALAMAAFLVSSAALSAVSFAVSAAGLGTKLFNELASNWEYSKQGELNLLKFRIQRAV
jgi:hypothetical protein